MLAIGHSQGVWTGPDAQLWSPHGPCRQSPVKPWAWTRRGGAQNTSGDLPCVTCSSHPITVASWPGAPIQVTASDTGPSVRGSDTQFDLKAFICIKQRKYSGHECAVPFHTAPVAELGDPPPRERSRPEPIQPWGCGLRGGSGHHPNFLRPGRARVCTSSPPCGKGQPPPSTRPCWDRGCMFAVLPGEGGGGHRKSGHPPLGAAGSPK